ncbi:MAG: glutamate formimidoyltransferase [Planctomycetota bacterium]|nr:glutamate formimidoyltransferase [Planctomycetota bacterium]
MSQLVECVPNFSEGRRAEVVDEIVRCIVSVPGVALLDREMDADHNRCVITFAGEPEAALEANFQGVAAAARLIDLNEHQGEHPRMGATDVVPFIPLGGITLEECADLARRLAERVGNELEIPVFLYGAASPSGRKSVSKVRKGQFEGLKETLGSNPDHIPDHGPHRVHPTAGATGIGARFFLIAYNVNLKSQDLKLAKGIAKKIRASSPGGLPRVQSLGFDLKEKNCVQVSMNLTDYRVTGLVEAYQAVEKEAAAEGVGIEESEIVGLVPDEAVRRSCVSALQAKEFQSDQIIERRLEKTPLGERGGIDEFLGAVASKAPTPGGGTVSALSGALAASLVEMVCNLTTGSKKYAEVKEEFAALAGSMAGTRARLVGLMDEDAEAFDKVMASFKIPKDAPERKAKIQEAMIGAAETPLETARQCLEVLRQSLVAAGKGNKNALSDAGTAAALARAGIRGAAYNVRINVASIKDESTGSRLRDALEKIESEAVSLDREVSAKVAGN